MPTPIQIANAAANGVMPLVEELRKKNRELEERIKKLETNQTLFNALTEKRKEVSEMFNVPAYCIATDSSLYSLCDKRPKTLADLKHVYGFGDYKIIRYGYIFLSVISKSV